MGGRKSYPIKRLLGDLRQSVGERKDLASAMEEKNPEKIASTTLKTFIKSDTAIENLTKTFDMVDVILSLSEESIEPQNLKDKIVKKWSEKKYKEDITIDSQIENNLINSIFNILKEDKKNE